MKIRFNTVMCVIWTIVAIVNGLYATANGGAMGSDNSFQDPSIGFIAAAFGVPGLLSIVFGFCNSVEDIMKLKNAAKDIKSEIKQ